MVAAPSERKKARMNKPKPRRPIERPRSSTVLAISVAAIFAAVVVATRHRSRRAVLSEAVRFEQLCTKSPLVEQSLDARLLQPTISGVTIQVFVQGPSGDDLEAF